MTDPYRITEETHTALAKPVSRLRAVLWLLLIVAAAANIVLSTALGNVWAGSAFGVVALGCAVALIVHHYRHRSSD